MKPFSRNQNKMVGRYVFWGILAGLLFCQGIAFGNVCDPTTYEFDYCACYYPDDPYCYCNPCDVFSDCYDECWCNYGTYCDCYPDDPICRSSGDGIINGRVTDGTNGIENALVYIYSYEIDTYWYTYTEYGGYYTFSGLPYASDYYIYVYHETPEMFMILYYYSSTLSVPTEEMATPIGVTDSMPVENIDMIISEDERSIMKGCVFFENTSTPAAPDDMIWVNAWSEEGGWYYTLTDSNGCYEITGLYNDITDYKVYAEYDDYPWAFYHPDGTVYEWDDAALVAPSGTERRDIVLSSGFTVYGAVTENGFPYGDLEVLIVSDSGVEWYAYTEDYLEYGDNYWISGLLPGTYTVSISPFFYSAQQKTITITDSDVQVNFALFQEEPRTISGVINDLEPEEYAWIYAYSDSTYDGGSTEVIGKSGTDIYEITGLPPLSDYIVELWTENYPPIIYNGKTDWLAPDYVDISYENQPNIDFDLTSFSALSTTISGTITFPNGATIGETAWVEAYSPALDYYNYTMVEWVSGNSVSYRINGLLPSHDYFVYVSSNFKDVYYNNASMWENATPVDTTDDDPDTAINFILQAGLSISGKVEYDDKSPVAGIEVEAYSEKTYSYGYSYTNQTGNFVITGLDNATDFIVNVWHPTLGYFYYNSVKTVKTPENATKIGVPKTNLIFTISQGKKIFGQVTNKQGSALANVWVSAWSDTLMAGGDAYTETSGNFTINGLPEGRDYEVTAVPDGQKYLPKTVTGIETEKKAMIVLDSIGSTQTVTGTITANGQPIANAYVELWSPTLSFYGYWYELYDITDKNGQYEITGVPSGSDYILYVQPPENINAAVYSQENFDVTTGNPNIQLDEAQTINGVVQKKKTDGTIINATDAWVYAYSESKNFWGSAFTNANGEYEITNVPDAADYMIEATASGYLENRFTGKTPGAYDFILETGASISGYVREASSENGIKSAIVTAQSVSNADFFGAAVTDKDGKFEIPNLKSMDDNNQLITDYTIQATKIGYLDQSVSNKQAGDNTVELLLSQGGNTNKLYGEILNLGEILNSVQLPNDFQVKVDLFNENDKFIKTVTLALNAGKFEITGLDNQIKYKLQFHGFTPDIEYHQWVGTDGVGIKAVEGELPPLGSKVFATGGNVAFQFNLAAPGRSIRTSESIPGPVVGLRSTSHVPVMDSNPQITRANEPKDIKLMPGVQVSNNPNITVAWESPDEEPSPDSYAYYYVFSKESTYNIEKRNVPDVNPIKVKKATSPNLTGDDVNYYFYVAAVDDRGRIGDTSLLGFRIDTVPPKNPNVSATRDNTTRNITLELAAQGATEMYISNTSYGENGKWEKFSTTKQLNLRDASDQKIYVQFRDLGLNTINVSATLKDQASAETLSKVIRALQITSGVKADVTGIVKTGDTTVGVDEAIYYLQVAAGLR